MNTLPFGHAVLLWRLERGLTQAALAGRAGLPRPNLSALERGSRPVSLPTIRRLAAARAVRPGILVDGLPPAVKEGSPPVLSRQVVERIADAVAFNRPLMKPDEQTAAEDLRLLLGPRMRAARRQWSRPRVGRRRVLAAWIRLKSVYGQAAIQMLADRVVERQGA